MEPEKAPEDFSSVIFDKEKAEIRKRETSYRMWPQMLGTLCIFFFYKIIGIAPVLVLCGLGLGLIWLFGKIAERKKGGKKDA